MSLHLVVTDSGVGGLSACAALERAFAASGDDNSTAVGAGFSPREQVRITYVNAWPSEQGGYNDMAGMEEEARVFDRALDAMAGLKPDRIVIACNTLSIVYEHTRFCRGALPRSEVELPRGTFPPVIGIVDAGVELFYEALQANPESMIALLGTKTTIESDVHRGRLLAKGIPPGRIVPVGCHGLAKSIETEMDGPTTRALIDECTARAARQLAAGTDETAPLFLAICCTHYTYVREEMKVALERHAGRQVQVLDPTDLLVTHVVAQDGPQRGVAAPLVSVISKVTLPEAKRRVIAARLSAVSPATAEALMAYTRLPNLF